MVGRRGKKMKKISFIGKINISSFSGNIKMEIFLTKATNIDYREQFLPEDDDIIIILLHLLLYVVNV